MIWYIGILIIIKFIEVIPFLIYGIICLNEPCDINNASAGFIGASIGILLSGLILSIFYGCRHRTNNMFEFDYFVGFMIGLSIFSIICGILVYISTSELDGSIMIGIGSSIFVDTIVYIIILILYCVRTGIANTSVNL